MFYYMNTKTVPEILCTFPHNPWTTHNTICRTPACWCAVRVQVKGKI